jgi:predicted tellurium resistance membrane protein TerC
MNQESGRRQNRAQTREDEEVFRRESPLAGRHLVARIPLSTGARFCLSSAQGCLFRWPRLREVQHAVRNAREDERGSDPSFDESPPAGHLPIRDLPQTLRQNLIISSKLMRAIMIALSVALITKFTWIIYVFGAFLILTGIKMVLKREEELHPERNPVVRWFKQLMPVTSDYRQDRFFVVENGLRHATPLFVVLLLVEFSDLIFAVDSIPAIFAVTTDPFIVYTSNVFAILGLRSLYFALAGVMDKFHYLKIGLGVVLAFVGVKMLLAHTAHKLDTLGRYFDTARGSALERAACLDVLVAKGQFTTDQMREGKAVLHETVSLLLGPISGISPERLGEEPMPYRTSGGN